MGRAPCCEKARTNKRAWTQDEDDLLISYIESHGEGCWKSLPKAAGLLRCGKSCRLRWTNYLHPDLKRGNFTEEEDELIIRLHSLLGNRWSLIAGRLPGRTDNELKNHWNTRIKRKLLSCGLDPQTHRPIINNQQQQQSLQIDVNQKKMDSVADGHSSSGMSTDEETTDLNLDLSISLPWSSSPRKEETVASSWNLCLCCNLGFGSSGRCDRCQMKSSNPHVIRQCIEHSGWAANRS